MHVRYKWHERVPVHLFPFALESDDALRRLTWLAPYVDQLHHLHAPAPPPVRIHPPNQQCPGTVISNTVWHVRAAGTSPQDGVVASRAGRRRPGAHSPKVRPKGQHRPKTARHIRTVDTVDEVPCRICRPGTTARRPTVSQWAFAHGRRRGGWPNAGEQALFKKPSRRDAACSRFLSSRGGERSRTE